MSNWLIALVGCIYLYIAVDNALHQRWDISLMFFGYAIAQAAVYMIAIK
jgi:hypothetical protein